MGGRGPAELRDLGPAPVRRQRPWALPVLLAVWACGAPGSWDLGALRERHPGLDAIDGHRLAEMRPYLLPARGELLFLSCRWPDGAEIPVSLPRDATVPEQNDILRALQAWESLGLGVRFAPRRGEIGGRGIEIRYTSRELHTGGGPRAATALADCAIAASAWEELASPVLPAELSFASLSLTREGFDAIGRAIEWSRAERLGALLHELGHALGFQGHASRGDTVMVAETWEVERAGRRLLGGEPFEDATLRALYAFPSGSVLRRVPVGAERTRPADRLVVLAAERGLSGPFAQMGDGAATLLWRYPRGAPASLVIWKVKEVLRRPQTLRLMAQPRAAALLED